MPGTIARGREAIKAAQEAAKAGGGPFRPFLPSIYWKDDREEHYLLVLTPVDQTPQFEMVRYIPTERGFFEEAVAKTDQFFEEKSDPFVEEWKGRTQTTDLAIAVELKPILVAGRGGKFKPSGFEVETTEYTRKLVDDKGELTGEEEEVTAPVIGYIAGNPSTLFAPIENFDANEAPITETAVKITRLGKDQNTSYTIQGYEDQEIKLDNLFEYVEGIGYLRDDMDAILDEIEGKDDNESAAIIAEALLQKKIDELTDEDRYQELLDGMKEPFRQFGGSGGKKTSKGSGRSSSRRSSKSESKDEDEKPRRRARSTKAEEKTEEKPARRRGRSRETADDGMSRLRQKAEAEAA